MKHLIPASLADERIDRVVAALTGLTRSAVAQMVDLGGVSLDGTPAKSRGQKVVEGQILEFELPTAEDGRPEAESGIEFGVVFADEHLVIIDKPSGLVVHPGSGHADGTLVNGLLERFPDMQQSRPGGANRPGIVHRLDAGTSGLLVVARTEAAYEALVSMMKERQIERHYLTLLWGDVQPDEGVIDAPIGRAEGDRTKMTVSNSGRMARTRYQVLERHADPIMSLAAAKLETGRTHQIRVHFAAINHPVVGDRRYRGVRQGVEVDRPFLHARNLRFPHPITGEQLSFDSPLPKDLRGILRKLGLDITE